MLHIINKQLVNADTLSFIKDNDVVLLIEDGVYLLDLNINKNIYALKPDVIARGLLSKISPAIKLIDYREFVDLTVQHYPIVKH